MPSNDNDMDNPSFSPRQLAQLDEILDKRGFNALQRQELARLRAGMLEDAQHVAKFILEQLRVELRLALEPSADTARRVEHVEEAKLPERVARLEAAVFPPPKPPRRRRS